MASLNSLNFLYSQHPFIKSFGHSKICAIYSHRLNILSIREILSITRERLPNSLCTEKKDFAIPYYL